MNTRSVWSADEGCEIAFTTTPSGRTMRSCQGCGGAGCWECEGTGWTAL